MIPPVASPARAAPKAHEPAAGSGAGARLANLLVDPVAAFRGIGDSPAWVLTFVLAVAIRLGSVFVFYQPAVTPLKLIAGLLFQFVTVAPTVLLATLVVWLTAKVWRVSVAWTPAFSVVTHVYVAYTLATIAFASVAGALLPESADVDLRNPPFTNFTSVLDDSGSATIRSLARELDVRSGYVLLLLWLGVRGAAPNVPRFTVAKVLATIAFVRVAGVIMISLLR